MLRLLKEYFMLEYMSINMKFQTWIGGQYSRLSLQGLRWCTNTLNKTDVKLLSYTNISTWIALDPFFFVFLITYLDGLGYVVRN